MAVRYDPGGEAGQGERVISSGGNIYTALDPVRVGTATRGRGSWTGKKREDDENPDVDDPKREDVNVLQLPDKDEDDGFDDDDDPFTAFYRVAKPKEFREGLKRQARAFNDTVAAASAGRKSILFLRGANVDSLLQNPKDMTVEQLLQNADLIKSLVAGASTTYEATLLRARAAQVANALRKAILTKPSSEKEKKPKKSHQSKASEKKSDGKGKTQYKYPKKGNAKGVNSDGARQGDAKGQPQAPEEAAPPEPVPTLDPGPVCAKLGVDADQFTRFAKKKTKQEFIDWFRHREDLLAKLKVDVSFLARLYDTLTNPPPPPQTEQQAGNQAQVMQQMGAQAMQQIGQRRAKSMLVVFNGATLDRGTLALIDMLKSQDASTVENIQSALQTHYATTEHEAEAITRSLLTKWQRNGLVTFYQAE